MTLYAPLNLSWAPLAGPQQKAEKAHARLARILRSWEGTPYLHGQGERGVGSDCVRSTINILAEWMRWTVPNYETLPADRALHDKVGAIRALRQIRRALPSHSRLRGVPMAQPGDVLITGHPAGGPGHVIIVGTERNTLWQATQSAGFVKGGWALPCEYSRLFAVLRFDNICDSF